MRQRLQFITLVVLGFSFLLALAAALGPFEPDLLFIVSFMLFVAIVELTAPDVITVPWRRKLGWFTVLGLLVSGVLLSRRVLETIPDGSLFT